MTATPSPANRSASRRHGEYKVPGGKLVVVDLDVVDGHLANVSLSGDFFLEPDEALLDINRGLTGLPDTTTAAELAAVVSSSLPPGAALFGFSADAVAVTVRRALAKATSWADHHWNVIAPTVLPTEINVALDEVLTEEVGAGRRHPTLRFWDWQEPSTVIGSFQSYRNEVDPGGVAKHGIKVVRRISGGGAMFMEAGNCITYSLYLPQTLVDGLSFADSYPFLDAWVMAALEKLGINAFYVPLNDIATDQGKIGGAAQKRLANGGMLHHVTMSYDIDADKMVDVLRIGWSRTWSPISGACATYGRNAASRSPAGLSGASTRWPRTWPRAPTRQRTPPSGARTNGWPPMRTRPAPCSASLWNSAATCCGH